MATHSNSHGARLVHQIIKIIKWIRTSRLSRKNSLSLPYQLPFPRWLPFLLESGSWCTTLHKSAGVTLHKSLHAGSTPRQAARHPDPVAQNRALSGRLKFTFRRNKFNKGTRSALPAAFPPLASFPSGEWVLVYDPALMGPHVTPSSLLLYCSQA